LHFSPHPPQGLSFIHFWESIHTPTRIRIICRICDTSSLCTIPATSEKGGTTHGKGVEGRGKL